MGFRLELAVDEECSWTPPWTVQGRNRFDVQVCAEGVMGLSFVESDRFAHQEGFAELRGLLESNSQPSLMDLLKTAYHNAPWFFRQLVWRLAPAVELHCIAKELPVFGIVPWWIASEHAEPGDDDDIHYRLRGARLHLYARRCFERLGMPQFLGACADASRWGRKQRARTAILVQCGFSMWALPQARIQCSCVQASDLFPTC